MGRKCFVSGCRSGYPHCQEKAILFNVPADPERLQAWAQAIPRKNRMLSTKDAVCSKHFTDDMILKKRYFGELAGEVLLDVPKRSVLSEDAIPCIFPSSPVHPSSESRKRKTPTTGHPPPLPKARKKYCKFAAAAKLQEI